MLLSSTALLRQLGFFAGRSEYQRMLSMTTPIIAAAVAIALPGKMMGNFTQPQHGNTPG